MDYSDFGKNDPNKFFSVLGENNVNRKTERLTNQNNFSMNGLSIPQTRSFYISSKSQTLVASSLVFKIIL